MWYEGGGQYYNVSAEDMAARGPEHTMRRVPTYTSSQGEQYQWAPGLEGNPEWQAPNYTPSYGSTVLQLLDKQASGQPLSLAEQSQWDNATRGTAGMPTRDWRTLPLDPSNPTRPGLPSIGDPDYLPMLVQVHQAATYGDPQARALLPEIRKFQELATYNSTIKQDSFSPLGDNLFGALMMLGMGASMGSAAPLFAAGTTAGTLGGVGATTGALSTLTSMLGEGLDLDALRKASIAMGAAGGFAGAGSLLSGGLNSIGDYLKLAQKLYGAGSKTLGLAQGGGSTPDTPRQVGGTSQALSAADQRTAGRTSSGSSTGGSSMAEGNILDSLGPLLGAAVGAVGMGISLDDTKRFMDQLKTRYGQQEETKRLIDQAYQLAVARYEMTYAQSQEERFQKQTAYEDAWNKYQTHYGQTQIQHEQQQAQYAKDSGQIDEDRFRQISTWNENRRNDLDNFAERRSQALEARQEEQGIFREQYGRHLSREDEIAAGAREERGLDLNAYQQRQAVGRNLSDPAAIAAGAQALYQPISAAARDRINTQTEEEMARRGVAGGGQYSNLMAAKAFAPQEATLWQNAMQNYLAGQTGAVNAYSQQDMTQVPRYNYLAAPDYATSPDYNLGGPPALLRAGGATVPTPPSVGTPPGVPTTDWNALRFAPTPPGGSTYYPQPYSPYGSVDGSGGAGGGGIGGALKNAGPLAEQLGKLLGGNAGLVSQVMKLLGGGGGSGDVTDAWLRGGSWESTSPLGDQNSLAYQAVSGLGLGDEYYGGSSYPAGFNFTPDYSYDYTGGDMSQMPYDDWSW